MKSSAEDATSFKLAVFHRRWIATKVKTTTTASAKEITFSPF
jgi:hypothetical protein